MQAIIKLLSIFQRLTTVTASSATRTDLRSPQVRRFSRWCDKTRSVRTTGSCLLCAMICVGNLHRNERQKQITFDWQKMNGKWVQQAGVQFWKMRWTVGYIWKILLELCMFRALIYIGVGAQSTWGGTRHFCPKNMYEKLTKCPNFTWFLPEKLAKYPNFYHIFLKN